MLKKYSIFRKDMGDYYIEMKIIRDKNGATLPILDDEIDKAVEEMKKDEKETD